jgi:hypothetical protein
MIDASIYSQIKQPQQLDVGESLGKVMNLRNMQQQGDLNKIKLASEEQNSKLERAKQIQAMTLPVMESLASMKPEVAAAQFPIRMKELEQLGAPMNNVPKDQITGEYIYDPMFVKNTYATLKNTDFGLDRQKKVAEINNLNRKASGEYDPYKMMMMENMRLSLDEKKKGKQLASEQVNRLSEYDSSLNMLDELKSTISNNKDKFGPAKGALGKLNKYDTVSQSINASIAKANQVVGKALEGGKLAEGDAIRYQKMLADLADQPEVAIEKIDQVIKLVSDKKNSEIKTFKEAGLNVSNFANEDRPSNSLLKTEKKSGGIIPSAEAADVKNNGGMIKMLSPTGKPIVVPASMKGKIIADGGKVFK